MNFYWLLKPFHEQQLNSLTKNQLFLFNKNKGKKASCLILTQFGEKNKGIKKKWYKCITEKTVSVYVKFDRQDKKNNSKKEKMNSKSMELKIQ